MTTATKESPAKRPVYTQEQMKLQGTLVSGKAPSGQQYTIEGRMTIARINELIETAPAAGYIELNTTGWSRWAKGEMKIKDAEAKFFLKFKKGKPVEKKAEDDKKDDKAA